MLHYIEKESRLCKAALLQMVLKLRENALSGRKFYGILYLMRTNMHRELYRCMECDRIRCI